MRTDRPLPLYALAATGTTLADRPPARAAHPAGGTDASRARRTAALAALSDRERTVLRMIAEGYNGPEIGRHLGISAKTVDTYKQRVEEKLGLAHRTEYVRFALETDLLHK